MTRSKILSDIHSDALRLHGLATGVDLIFSNSAGGRSPQSEAVYALISSLVDLSRKVADDLEAAEDAARDPGPQVQGLRDAVSPARLDLNAARARADLAAEALGVDRFEHDLLAADRAPTDELFAWCNEHGVSLDFLFVGDVRGLIRANARLRGADASTPA